MQETSASIVNHARIMVEEMENSVSCNLKCYWSDPMVPSVLLFVNMWPIVVWCYVMRKCIHMK